MELLLFQRGGGNPSANSVRGLKKPGVPKRHIQVTGEEWQVILDVVGKPVQFLIDTETTYSLKFLLWSFVFWNLLHCAGGRREGGKVTSKHHTLYEPLPCICKDTLVTHTFLIMPEHPYPLMGRDFLPILGTTLSLPEVHGLFLVSLCPPEEPQPQAIPPTDIWNQVNSQVWDRGILGQSKLTQPGWISFRAQPQHLRAQIMRTHSPCMRPINKE